MKATRLFFHPVCRILIGGGIILSFLLNLFHQGFCQPVLYAKVWMILFLFSWLLIPFVNKSNVLLPVLFIYGSGFSIILYCLYFLIHANEDFLMMLIFPLSLAVYVTLVFMLLEYFFVFREKVKLNQRVFMLAGLILPFIVQGIFIFRYQSSFSGLSVLDTKTASYQEIKSHIPANYFTERYLARHWKYHTRICMYDGWRPPLHDPLMNIAVDFSGEPNLDMNIKSRLYQDLFPDLPYWADCSCAPFNSDANSYLRSR